MKFIYSGIDFILSQSLVFSFMFSLVIVFSLLFGSHSVKSNVKKASIQFWSVFSLVILSWYLQDILKAEKFAIRFFLYFQTSLLAFLYYQIITVNVNKIVTSIQKRYHLVVILLGGILWLGENYILGNKQYFTNKSLFSSLYQNMYFIFVFTYSLVLLRNFKVTGYYVCLTRYLLILMFLTCIANIVTYLTPFKHYLHIFYSLTVLLPFFKLVHENMPQYINIFNERKYQKSRKIDNDLLQKVDVKVNEILEKQKHYMDPELDLTKLAQIFGIKRNLLSQVLNEHYQMTFYEFIARYRVRESIKLLTNPNNAYTISEAAFEVGFTSISTYNNWFKKITKLSPRQYLKNYRKEKCTNE